MTLYFADVSVRYWDHAYQPIASTPTRTRPPNHSSQCRSRQRRPLRGALASSSGCPMMLTTYLLPTVVLGHPSRSPNQLHRVRIREKVMNRPTPVHAPRT